MKTYLLLALTATLIFPTPSQSDTNHFGAGGVFELDLGDSEIPLTPKQERETVDWIKLDSHSSKNQEIYDKR